MRRASCCCCISLSCAYCCLHEVSLVSLVVLAICLALSFHCNTHTNTHTHTHTHTHTRTHTHISFWHKHTHTHARTNVTYKHAQTRPHTRTHTYTHFGVLPGLENRPEGKFVESPDASIAFRLTRSPGHRTHKPLQVVFTNAPHRPWPDQLARPIGPTWTLTSTLTHWLLSQQSDVGASPQVVFPIPLLKRHRSTDHPKLMFDLMIEARALTLARSSAFETRGQSRGRNGWVATSNHINKVQGIVSRARPKRFRRNPGPASSSPFMHRTA